MNLGYIVLKGGICVDIIIFTVIRGFDGDVFMRDSSRVG